MEWNTALCRLALCCLVAAPAPALAAWDAFRLAPDFAGGRIVSATGPDGTAYSLAPDGSLWIDAQRFAQGPYRQAAMIGRTLFAQVKADGSWRVLKGGALVVPDQPLVPLLEGRDTATDLVVIGALPWRAVGVDFDTVAIAADAACRYGVLGSPGVALSLKAGTYKVLPATFGIDDPAPNVLKTLECQLPDPAKTTQ